MEEQREKILVIDGTKVFMMGTTPGPFTFTYYYTKRQPVPHLVQDPTGGEGLSDSPLSEEHDLL